jgi:crotonobetainyl-CoA:carnitine CoA-transferase CaiB-like acyl-CoA transferase
VTGYGLAGPDKDRPGFDVAAFWARSGAASAFAPKGSDPFPIRTAFGDHVTSIAAAAGILAALVERQQSGRGRLVEASLLRAANYAMGSDLAIQQHFGRLASTRPRHRAVSPLANFFKTRDERWLCLVPRQGGKDFALLCRAIDRHDIAEDARFTSARGRREHVAELVTALDEAFAQFDFADIAARLDAVDFVWAPVQTPAEAVADPQLAAAGGFVDIACRDGGAIKSPASPVRFSNETGQPIAAAPSPGEHTHEILAELGYSAGAIADLIEGGAAKTGT